MGLKYFDSKLIENVVEIERQTGDELLPKLVEEFGREFEVLFTEMLSSVQKKDALVLNRAAHTLKSSAAHVGAARIMRIAIDIEKLSNEKMSDFDIFLPRLEDLRDDYEPTMTEIKNFLETR